jgi:hypothetical protein
MMEHLKFAGKVALVILVINQIPALSGMLNKNYFGGNSGA